MDNSCQIHRRQFAIGPNPILVNDRWKHIKISEKTFLSYDSALPIQQGFRPDGEPFFLLGIPVQSDPSRREPADEAEQCSGDISKIYDTWTGRWIYIGASELHMDYAGLLGCFYVFSNGALWISSSVAILSEIIMRNNTSLASMATRSTLNWYPLPRARNPLIRSLLPSQVLKLPSGQLEPKQLFPSERFYDSELEAVDAVATFLTTAIQRLPVGRLIHVALSAGYDSRLLLAAAVNAGVEVKTYTMKKHNRFPLLAKGRASTSPVSRADMTLPPEIAALANVEHRWIKENDFSEQRLREFDLHTYKQTLENDRVYYARGQWKWPEDDSIILLGQLSGIGSCAFYRLFAMPGLHPSKICILKNLQINPPSIQAKAISEYIEWVGKYLEVFQETVDWRDRFYLEQRAAGWLSSLQQGLDLIRGERVHLLNSQRLACALLSLPEEKRQGKKFVRDLINRMAPDLNRIPYNPPDPFFYKVKRILVDISQNPISNTLARISRRLHLR